MVQIKKVIMGNPLFMWNICLIYKLLEDMYMKNTLNQYNLKHKVLKDLYTFLIQSVHLKYINFKEFKNISSFNKCKCLILSKNISYYLKEKEICKINNSLLYKLIKENIKNKRNLKLYKKNIELIKFYTILFTDKSLSHLTFYLFNNSKLSMLKEDKPFLSIVIKKDGKTSVILDETLNVFTKRNIKEPKGDIFTYRHNDGFSLNIKYKFYLFLFSFIIGYFLFFNIPNNYIIMEMNLTMHMKMNQNGYILSYRPKTKGAKNMIKENRQYIRTLNHSIPSFIDYGLEKDILKPGNHVKIYIIGPPLKDKFFNKLHESLKDKHINITINNGGSLIKINST